MTAVPKVTTCTVSACCFNEGSRCHAGAIQVGRDHPMCDTFTPQSGTTCGAPDLNGDVGACLVDDCRYNVKLLCSAPGIVVGAHAGHADCQTYQHR